MRVHVSLGTTSFSPSDAPRWPGRKTRLEAVRSTQGIDGVGRLVCVSGDWSSNIGAEVAELSWTGNNAFIVDKKHEAGLGYRSAAPEI